MINEEEEEDITINIMTLGNSSVGKTSYIIKYTDNYFREIYLSTIGIDRKVKSIKLNNKNIKLIFHDTTGQERFKSLSFNIIKNADGVILMYDITNKESFESIPEWIKNVTESKGNDFPKILLGNKIDKENKRILSYEEGNKIAKDFDIDFFETSVKEGINIDESCKALVEKILINLKNKEKKNNISLNDGRDSSLSKSEEKCC